jgi:hypothetical protein
MRERCSMKWDSFQKPSSAQERLDVDGASKARDFLRSHDVPQADVDTVWTAIAAKNSTSFQGSIEPRIAAHGAASSRR